MPRINRSQWTAGIFIAVLAAAIAVPAVAQKAESKPPVPKPQQQQVNVEVSDKEVRQFANVYLESHALRRKYAGQFQSAEKNEDKRKIQQQMQQEMRNKIEASPLTMQRYQRIARAAAQDQVLRQRILSKVQEIQQTQ